MIYSYINIIVEREGGSWWGRVSMNVFARLLQYLMLSDKISVNGTLLSPNLKGAAFAARVTAPVRLLLFPKKPTKQSKPFPEKCTEVSSDGHLQDCSPPAALLAIILRFSTAFREFFYEWFTNELRSASGVVSQREASVDALVWDHDYSPCLLGLT